jgi:hypothetical protein
MQQQSSKIIEPCILIYRHQRGRLSSCKANQRPRGKSGAATKEKGLNHAVQPHSLYRKAT